MSNPLIFSGATSNRKSVCITLFFNKLYLFYDVNPLNKVFTALHRLTQVCILIRSEKRHKSNGELTNAQDSEFIQLHNVHNLRFNPVNAIPFPTQRYMNEVKEKEFPRS